ncbi:MAG: hypothetical protein WD399_07535 [Thermoleophilaceae bacterium]
MRHDPDILERLADGRRHRLRADGRPVFELTAEEIERSTKTAMRLADASKSQARRGPAERLPSQRRSG